MALNMKRYSEVYQIGTGKTYRALMIMLQRAEDRGGRFFYVAKHRDSIYYLRAATRDILTKAGVRCSYKIATQTLVEDTLRFSITFITLERLQNSFAIKDWQNRVFFDHSISEV